MSFKSKLCNVCRTTLQQTFETLGDSSQTIPHHRTKESLVDSVLHQGCHLCRLIIYHYRRRWAPEHQQGVEDLTEVPTSLTKHDFQDSDFEFETFPSDRVVVLSYLLELPELFEMNARITKYLLNGEMNYLLEFDCDGLGTDKPRFWVFDEKAFGMSPITSRPNESTSATSCQQALKNWLEQCSSHEICGVQKQSFLPTRLLDIGLEHGDPVRLVMSRDLEPGSRYVTLSHCWGEKVPFQLRSETMKYMMEGFKVDEMPKTFQDAVAVARWADVRFIWIDSCCIIQGDTADWAREARTMQKVYANTYFNISAAHSENSHGGCFSDRLAYKITPCPYAAPNLGQVYLVPRFGLTRPLVEAHIASRAWVVQERFLSPRKLHFTDEQMFWECPGMYACETFPRGIPAVYEEFDGHYRTSARVLSNNDRSPIYKIWGRLCEDYSLAALTYTSDRLIAFAGIVADFGNRLPNDTYLAGLWKGDLMEGLLWKARALDGWPNQPNGSHELNATPYITASVPSSYRAPSWSWLGSDCSIWWQRKKRHSPRSLVEILDVSIELVDEVEPARDMKGGYIVLEGHLRVAQWVQSGEYTSIVLDGKSGPQLLSSSDDICANCHFTVQRDTGTEFPVQDIFLLPLRMSLPSGGPTHGTMIFEGLVLAPTGKENEYQRLGHFEALGEGNCRAVLYEALPAAQEFSQPWRSLTPLLTEEHRVQGDGLGGQYDDDFFREVAKHVITLI